MSENRHEWLAYINNLRRHYTHCAALYPRADKYEHGIDYINAVREWEQSTYFSEPMYPGQEYANNH